MLLKLEWQYLQRTVLRIGTLMVPIKESLRDTLFPMLFGGEEINTDFRKILGHSVKCGGLGITDPWSSEESAYNTSKACIGELVGSLLGGNALNHVGHRSFVPGDSAGARKERKYVEMADLDRRKEMAGGQESNHLHRETSNGAWISAIPHCLNGM